MASSAIEVRTGNERGIRSNVELDILSSPTQDLGNEETASQQPPEDIRQSTPLPLADTGKDAWLFLISSVVLEIFVWGFPTSFGIFQSYYSSHAPFAGKTEIATVGTTATGLMFATRPLATLLPVFMPSRRFPFLVLSALMMVGSLIGSSFATTLPQLVATQGVLFGLGGSIVYSWMIVYLDQWFVRRKGLAYGIVSGGTGLAGAIIPPLLQALLDRYGPATTLRAWAAATFVFLIPAPYFIRPRLPPVHSRKIDLNFLVSPTFLILQLGNVIQSIGYFLPSLYLPTYARHLGSSTATAAATLIAFNVANVAGSVILGAMVDKMHVTTCTTLCAIGGAISVFLFWGLSSDLALLFVFAVSYGLTAGSYSSAWIGAMNLVSQKTQCVEPTMVMAFLAMGRGAGNIVSGPVSDGLMGSTQGNVKSDYGSGFGPLIVFTGATMVASGLSILGRIRTGLL